MKESWSLYGLLKVKDWRKWWNVIGKSNQRDRANEANGAEKRRRVKKAKRIGEVLTRIKAFKLAVDLRVKISWGVVKIVRAREYSKVRRKGLIISWENLKISIIRFGKIMKGRA